MKRPTILYLIDSLGYGGAEHLLVNTVNATADNYRNILVYLNPPNDLGRQVVGAEVIFLNKPGKSSIPSAIVALRRLIKEKEVDIVSAHSYWTIILSRFATPKNVGLVNTYHFADYETMKERKSCIRMVRLDKLTYNKRIQTVTVSKYVQGIIEDRCGYTSNIQTITNFVSERFFNAGPSGHNAESWQPGKLLKLVAMGSLKREKNYELLLEAFKELKHLSVQLDVYGDGDQLDAFRQQAKEQGINNLVFKGPTAELPTLLPSYDAYVMSSFSEACPLSPIEAMTAALPLILSDIPPLQEIAAGQALFFKNRDAASFVTLVKGILSGTQSLALDPVFAQKRLEHYSKNNFLKALDQVYRTAATNQ